MKIEEFAEEFRQEVLSRCEDENSEHFREDKFTEVMIEYLEQANEIDDGDICFHRNTRNGEKLNGYNISPDGEYLDLFVSCFHGKVPPESVSNSDVKQHFRWLRSFLEVSLGGLHRRLEESSPVFDTAQQIHAFKDDLAKVRFFLLTDGIVHNAKVEDSVIGGIQIKHFIWDLEKLRRFVESRMQREVIEIDFKNNFGGGIPCLQAADTKNEYQTFLLFFSGTLLTKLYGEYGPRLLEKNVRAFLQAKGKINKGIRTTILNEPNRFLAYNNGISVTAEKVGLEKSPDGFQMITHARDFQIVNGGQTTASMYHAFKRDAADLSTLMVQVKLTVLNDSKNINVFVPLISQYANSQNKVNTADFSANHPYHIKMEELSRRLWAPAATGTDRQTHWYYERARGSYLDDKSREVTPARMRAFEALNPLKQKFTKTDLAKYENTWNLYPHLVCRGAEKNFIKLTEMFIEKEYPDVNEDYFCRLVAKAILFKTAEKLVSGQNYGGFRANIVTFTLAWLAHRTAQRIDLDRIWREQKLSESLCNAITIISSYTNMHIVNPPANRRNPAEWTKVEECWEMFREKDINIPESLSDELVDTGRPTKGTKNSGKSAIPTDDEKREIEDILKVSSETWFGLARWAKETNNLQSWQRSLAFSLGKQAAGNRPPSSKQAHQGVKILEEAQRRGFKKP